MRGMAVVVALLLAAPVGATTVHVSCQQVDDTNQVEISYSTDGTLPRAFGLDIWVSDGNIVACEPAIVGESGAAAKGYGIFPGTIIVDAGGNVTDYGSPVAPQSDLPGDTQPGLGSPGITIEMGSLYVDGNAPPTSGLLCTITVEDTVTQMTIAANVSRAGNGVVLQDPDEVATVNLGTCDVSMVVNGLLGSTDCCGHTITKEEDELYASLGYPACWCDPCHCRGDANGSCSLNAVDINILRAAWPGFGGSYHPCVDVNYDGVINAIDINRVRTYWPGFGGVGCTGCPPCP